MATGSTVRPCHRASGLSTSPRYAVASWLLASGICLLVFCSSALAQSTGGQWQETTYPRAEGNPCRADLFLLTDTGGIGGGFGRGDPHNHLMSVDFWDANTGWSCGNGGAFKTADGGLNWQRVKPRGGWYHVRLTGPQEVWLLQGYHGEANAHLYRSGDEGASWSEELTGKVRGFSDLQCRGPTRWVMCGDFPSYYSNDEGKTWNPVGVASAQKVAVPGDVPGLGPLGYVAYVVCHQGPKGLLKKTPDGGKTWKDVPLPVDLPMARCIFFATSLQGCLGFDGGRVLATADGGQTWEARNLPTDQRVMAMWFDALGRGFVSVDNTDFYHPRQTLYETLDAGKTWMPVLGGNKQINAIAACGTGQLWAVGNCPTVLPNDLVAIWSGRW